MHVRILEFDLMFLPNVRLLQELVNFQFSFVLKKYRPNKRVRNLKSVSI